MKSADENRFSLDVDGLGPRPVEQFEMYLALLMKWNARMNLTAVRKPEEIVRRHFVCLLYTSRCV